MPVEGLQCACRSTTSLQMHPHACRCTSSLQMHLQPADPPLCLQMYLHAYKPRPDSRRSCFVMAASAVEVNLGNTVTVKIFCSNLKRLRTAPPYWMVRLHYVYSALGSRSSQAPSPQDSWPLSQFHFPKASPIQCKSHGYLTLLGDSKTPPAFSLSFLGR